MAEQEPQRIEDVFAPEWDNLLVEREKMGDVVGVGLGGQSLISPNAGKSMVGTVLRVGPDCPSWYAPGCRVIFGIHSGTRIEMPGQRDHDCLILPRSEVLAKTDGEEAGPPLDLSWKEHFIPPPGKLLVERMETPIARGRIIIPDGVSTARRSSEGRIHRVGVAAGDRFKQDDQVFIAGNVSRSFPLGYREEERLYVCEPGQIAGRILADPGKDGLLAESSVMRGAETIPDEQVEQRFDDGDSRAPQ